MKIEGYTLVPNEQAHQWDGLFQRVGQVVLVEGGMGHFEWRAGWFIWGGGWVGCGRQDGLGCFGGGWDAQIIMCWQDGVKL